MAGSKKRKPLITNPNGITEYTGKGSKNVQSPFLIGVASATKIPARNISTDEAKSLSKARQLKSIK